MLIQQIEMNDYHKKVDLEKNKFVVWSLYQSQSAEIIKKKVKKLKESKDKEKEKDCAQLIFNICKIYNRIGVLKYFFINLHEARRVLLTHKEIEDQTIIEFVDKL